MSVYLGRFRYLQDGAAGQVATVAEVGSSHHVLGVEHLLGEFRHGDGTEGVSAGARQGSETDHEEVETGERNHVHSQLTQIRVELTGESQTGGDAGHDSGDEVVQVTVGRVRQLQGAHADVVESLVVNAKGLIRVLDQLVDRESGVVGLNDGVGHLGGWHNGEGGHHSVGELLADLGDQKSTHTRSGTTAEGVGDLEALEAVAAFGLTADHVKDVVDELGALSVVTLGPVVAGRGLAEDEVVGSEELTERTGTDGVHGAGLKIDEDSARNILVVVGLHHPRSE